MRDPHDVLIKPMVSEKSMAQMEERKYTFFVDKAANKIEIKYAVESLFPKVKVEKVTTLILKGKIRTMGKFSGKRPDRKKAIVTLKEGKLDLFESMQ